MQRKRIAAGVSRPRGGGCRECASARKSKDSSLTLRMTGRGHAFPGSVILRPQAEESFSAAAHFIGDRTFISGTKHFNRSAGRSASCAAGDHRKRKPSARRGVDRKAGRFFSPRLRVLLWSFLPTREESGVPEIIESTIDNPAKPQICRRSTMQEGTDCRGRFTPSQ